MRVRVPRTLSSLALTLLVASVAGRAGVAVTFVDGRSMAVERVERHELGLALRLDNGSTMLVPEERVATWTAVPDPPPEPAPEPPPPPAPAAWRAAAGPYAELLGAAAERHGLDAALLTAMARVESGFDPRAVSSKGAQGLLQLIPATAERFGVADAFDVPQNVEGGARYLRWLLERYHGRRELALAGYNAGEGAVDRHGGIPPYRETQGYVADVLRLAAELGAVAP